MPQLLEKLAGVTIEDEIDRIDAFIESGSLKRVNNLNDFQDYLYELVE